MKYVYVLHGVSGYTIDSIYSCGGFNTRRFSARFTATLCVVTKGIKADCNRLMRTTYLDALRRMLRVGVVDC